ncbi:RidA family protein [Thermaurantiacus sp.]
MQGVTMVALVLAGSAAMAMTPGRRLPPAGHLLPEPVRPVATCGTHVRPTCPPEISGIFPAAANRVPEQRPRGEVGLDLSLEAGRALAGRVALGTRATLRATVGELSRVARVVRILGMVKASGEFTQH